MSAEAITEVQGIPCLARLTSYYPAVRGCVGHPDNWVPDEPEDCEFTLHSLKTGKRMGRLEDMMSHRDANRVRDLLLDDMRAQRDDALVSQYMEREYV